MVGELATDTPRQALTKNHRSGQEGDCKLEKFRREFGKPSLVGSIFEIIVAEIAERRLAGGQRVIPCSDSRKTAYLWATLPRRGQCDRNCGRHVCGGLPDGSWNAFPTRA